VSIDPPIRVLVICWGNSARSILAEALIRHHGGADFDVNSAGIEPKGLVTLLHLAVENVRQFRRVAALTKSGEIKMLAAVAPKRSALFPDLPTMAEQGIAGVDIESWIGFVGPAGMEPATVAKLSQAFGQVIAMPKIKEDFRVGGVEAQWASPEQFAGMIRESYNLWGRTVANIGLVKE